MSQTRRMAGVSVFSTSRRFATSSVWRLEIPVTLPPGRASWATIPAPTGSPTSVNTIGTVLVAPLAACVAASWLVTRTSTPDFTRASAAAGIASSLPSVKRISKTTSRPSWRPSSRRPALSPSTVGWLAANAALRTPMRNGRRASWASTVCAGRPSRSATTPRHRRTPRRRLTRDRRPGPPDRPGWRWDATTCRRSSDATSARDQLMVGALGHVVPGPDQRLEPRERRVDLAGHGGLLGFFPDHLGGQLPEVPQHRRRELEHLDLALELGPEPLERHRVLRVVFGAAVDLDGRCRVVEHAPQVDGQRLVGLPVEAELQGGARFVPPRVVVVPSRLVEAHLHVVVRADPLGRVDDAALERRVDLAARRHDGGGAGPRVDLAAEVHDPDLQPLVVRHARDLLAEPPRHLGRVRHRGTRDEVERGVRLLHELEAVALLEPGRHALRVHAEGDGREPLDRRLPGAPVLRGPHVRLEGALSRSVEAVEEAHDLATGEHLDPESPGAHLVDDLGHPQRCTLQHVEGRGPRGRHPPLDLRLRDDVRGADDAAGGSGRHDPAGPHEEPASSVGHSGLLIPRPAGGTRPRPRGPRARPAPGTA